VASVASVIAKPASTPLVTVDLHRVLLIDRKGGPLPGMGAAIIAEQRTGTPGGDRIGTSAGLASQDGTQPASQAQPAS
jgi:hypothetical protein